MHWRAFRRALVIGAVFAGASFVIARLDVFGIEHNSNHFADSVVQRMAAPLYPRGGKGDAAPGQNAIRVVYIDEHALTALRGVGWDQFPPKFPQQTDMLRDVLTGAGDDKPPAALFADFVYLGVAGRPEGFDDFVGLVGKSTRSSQWTHIGACQANPLMKIACIVEARGTPIIFGKPSPDVLAATPIQAELEQHAVLTPVDVDQEAYPLARSYDELRGPAESRGDFESRMRGTGVHGYDLSPAAALYAAYCLKARHGACGGMFEPARLAADQALAGRDPPPALFPKDLQAPVAVVWGSRPNTDAINLSRAVSGAAPSCRGAHESETLFWATARRIVEQLVLLRGAGQGSAQECPYSVAIGYDKIAAAQGLDAEDLSTLLAGKLVLLGGHLRASNDWVESPVHGQVPGVDYHAMALDNLVEFGADYRRNEPPFGVTELFKSFLEFTLVATIAWVVMHRNELLATKAKDHPEQRLTLRQYAPLYLWLLALSASAIMVATMVGLRLSHWAPINWIGVSVVVGTFFVIDAGEHLVKDLAGSLRSRPGGRKVVGLCEHVVEFFEYKHARLSDGGHPPPSPPGPGGPEPALRPDRATAQETSHASS